MESICKLKDLYKSLYKFEKAFQNRYDVTINEAMVLCNLYNGESHTAREISDYIGLSASRVSKIINAVEVRGYIERSIGDVDKRQMVFKLTVPGLQKISEMKGSDFDTEQLYKQLQKTMEE